MRLKRSKTDVSDLADNGAVQAPARDNAQPRPKRVFSFTKLTPLGAKRHPRHPSVDKDSISSPVEDPKRPIILPSSTLNLEPVTPPPFFIWSAKSSPGPAVSASAFARNLQRHIHTSSDPTSVSFTPENPPPRPTRPPPPLPKAASFECGRSLQASSRKGILEVPSVPSPFDQALARLRQRGIIEQLRQPPANMESSRLQPPPNMGTKSRAIQQAKEMEMLTAERAKRSGDEPPPYEFFELIGQGAYGRVFKGKNRTTNGLVAIKIIDIDKVDYEEMTSKNLQDVLKEINILQQLRDSKARDYVNIIEEARPVHNELWIVSEYASGGSVNTLMKPFMNHKNEPQGIPEKYIIPIARELGLGLKYIHEAGIIHRDLKCNNILISEEGRVQLCDFGVSGTLEPEIAKRSTIVGTPYWMAPELQKEWVKEADPNSRVPAREILYGSEVDIWAYGCTVFEMATGWPPFHKTAQWNLPQAGIPRLEGEYSENLKSLVAFVLQPNPQDRPTPDDILEHPYLANTSKMFPTVTLIQLIERYYQWEQGGGARASLFNPYGAQAPDPLAPEVEDDDDEWTFSTTDEFENRISRQYTTDPFASAASQGFTSISIPPADDDRFAKLQASFKEESINRGKKRLDRLFDKNSTPYRYSGMESGRPPSDLILRDFNPGAPNRETVIDLDFAAPTTTDMPSIDLGEVPTVKANRVNRLLREMQMEEEERDSFDEDDLTKRATRDWKFPAMNDQPNRRTVDWKFPAMPEKPNRRTVEWTFDAAMAEANYEPMPKGSRMSRRRDTQEMGVPMMPAPPEENRRTRDFVFPMRDPVEAQGGSLSDQGPHFSSSPTLEPGFQPSLRHATTEPLGSFDDYPRVSSAPGSPLRTSMIDLDIANVDDYRPSTSGSASTSTYTAGAEQLNGNPFDLEDQVHLSQSNNRGSYHMKSQSEPNQAIPGLLTPQTYDEEGQPTNQDSHHPSMHARGVSSVSQMQAQIKPTQNNYGGYRGNQRSQQIAWDGWNHSVAYGIGSDESPPASVSTDVSAEDEDIDDLWDTFERLTLQSTYRQYAPRRRNDSRDEDPRSDAEDSYAEAPYDDPIPRHMRVSVGPNGKPLVDFPVPRGPDLDALLGVDADPAALQNALWKSALEMREGLRASRHLLKSMRLEEIKAPGLEGFPEEPADEMRDQGTVRLAKT